MSTLVSHSSYEIHEWPKGHAEILYLTVGETPIGAATLVVGGWRVILYGDNSLGANVGDREEAFEWLHAVGQLASKSVVAA